MTWHKWVLVLAVPTGVALYLGWYFYLREPKQMQTAGWILVGLGTFIGSIGMIGFLGSVLGFKVTVTRR